MKKYCLFCENEIIKNYYFASNKYCSNKCYNDHKREKLKEERLYTCSVCNKEFLRAGKKKNNQTCSSKCGYELRKTKTKTITKKCKNCKTKIILYESESNLGYGIFCSFECRVEFNLINTAKIEIECFNCKSIFKRTRAAVERMNKSFCSEKCFFDYNQGENHPLYRGDKDPNRGSDWNKIASLVRERDNFECLRCGKTQEENKQKLSVDHIIPWRSFSDKKLANEMSNLASLCRACHTWKTNIAEHKWLKGDVIDMQKYINSIKGKLQ